jgi:hypothetical protein
MALTAPEGAVSYSAMNVFRRELSSALLSTDRRPVSWDVLPGLMAVHLANSKGRG